jgi:hypothetical protein
MRDKYYAGHFGVCPRVLCERQNVLPVGMSEDLRTSRVKVYIQQIHFRSIVQGVKIFTFLRKSVVKLMELILDVLLLVSFLL